MEELEAQAAVVLASAGDEFEAKRTIDPIRDESIRARAVIETAAHERAWLTHCENGEGEVNYALDAAGEAKQKGEREQARALLELGRVYVKVWNNPKAIETVKQALELAREWYARWLNGREQSALIRITEAFARAGNIKTAFGISARIRSDSGRQSARCG